MYYFPKFQISFKSSNVTPFWYKNGSRCDVVLDVTWNPSYFSFKAFNCVSNKLVVGKQDISDCNMHPENWCSIISKRRKQLITVDASYNTWEVAYLVPNIFDLFDSIYFCGISY